LTVREPKNPKDYQLQCRWDGYNSPLLFDLSAYAEYHGLCPWMNADSVGKKSSTLGLMLRRDSATGGYLAEALARIGQSSSALMGEGG